MEIGLILIKLDHQQEEDLGSGGDQLNSNNVDAYTIEGSCLSATLFYFYR